MKVKRLAEVDGEVGTDKPEDQISERMEDNVTLATGSYFTGGAELSLGMDLDFGLDCGSPSSDLGAPKTLDELVEFLDIGETTTDGLDFPTDFTFGPEDRWPI